MAFDVTLPYKASQAFINDMAPPTGSSVAWLFMGVRKLLILTSRMSMGMAITWMMLCMLVTVDAVEPNKEDHWNELPGLKETWDGIPFHEFRHTLWYRCGFACL